MKWRKRRQRPETDDGVHGEGTIDDVGRGIYGPDESETRPVSRFERTRVPSKTDPPPTSIVRT
jgi:hypothetical protein